MPVTSTSGQGRPKGIPNKATAEIKALAQTYGPAAIMRLAEMAGFAVDENGNKLKAAESEQAQIAATKELLDRGYGKSTQPIAGPDDGPIVAEVVYRWAPAEATSE